MGAFCTIQTWRNSCLYSAKKSCSQNGATWLYEHEHKQNHKKSSLKLLVRIWNNLIEMFLEWPFSKLFLKFWSVNKHGISEWRLLALYRQRNSCKFFSESDQKKLARAISKNQVSDPGPSWPSCLFDSLFNPYPAILVYGCVWLWMWSKISLHMYTVWSCSVFYTLFISVNITPTSAFQSIETCLASSQTSPDFYVPALQVFGKQCGKRRNCS